MEDRLYRLSIFFMAKGVRKTHLKHLQTLTDFYREVEGKEPNEDALKK